MTFSGKGKQPLRTSRPNGFINTFYPGDQVRLNDIYIRHRNGSQRYWQKVPAAGRGILVGIRTLQDGYMAEHHDRPATWVCTNRKRAALVLQELRYAPLIIPWESIELLDA